MLNCPYNEKSKKPRVFVYIDKITKFYFTDTFSIETELPNKNLNLLLSNEKFWGCKFNSNNYFHVCCVNLTALTVLLTADMTDEVKTSKTLGNIPQAR
jgi:hypothetical protein